MDPLNALSPLDGRYAATGAKLAPHFSESALIRNRLYVMIHYLIHLSETPGVPMPHVSELDKRELAALNDGFDLAQAQIVKDIEKKGDKATNHDVKACELYLRDRLVSMELGYLCEWVHFGRTSEDVNNIAYALMLDTALTQVLVPELLELHLWIQARAHEYANLAMLSRTHGQPATPTTLGHAFAVFASRLHAQIVQLQKHEIAIKFNGAAGNYAADRAAFPHIEWPAVSEAFCTRLRQKTGAHLGLTLLTTQIEPHDTYAELFAIMMRINTILIGFCQDIWRYVSDDWLVQKSVEGEVGSSTMPHKVNPIDFENAEGNMGLANCLLSFFCAKLPISRLQRDLSDSTVERNFGMTFGYCLLAYESIKRGMKKLFPNIERITKDLLDHPEVVTEALQTILRSIGYPDPYSVLKDLARGRKLTMEDIHAFIDGLDSVLVDDGVKARMHAITPGTYTGLAGELARSV